MNRRLRFQRFVIFLDMSRGMVKGGPGWWSQIKECWAESERVQLRRIYGKYLPAVEAFKAGARAFNRAMFTMAEAFRGIRAAFAGGRPGDRKGLEGSVRQRKSEERTTKTMDENVKVFTITVPGSPPESAKEFIRSLVTPTQDPEGNLSPPPRITFDRESGLRSVYIVGDLTFRSLGLGTDGSPLATVIKAVVMPVEAEDDAFVCPECKAEHSRGPLDPLSKVYRCLRCGYVGRRVKDEWVPCPECEGSGMVGAFDNPLLENLCSSCAGKGRVRKDAPGPMVLTGDVEKGPVDKPKTVETPEEFAGEFGDGKTFSSDEGKQKLKRRILDRMTAVDMVDAISNGCDLPNLADIIIDLYPPEEILEMTPKEGLCPECKGTGVDENGPSRISKMKNTCSRCAGTGKVIVEEEEDVLEEVTHHDLVIVEDLPRDDCPECLGNGKKFYGEPDETDCPRCNGTGKV